MATSKFQNFLDWSFGGDISGGLEKLAFGAQLYGAGSKFLGTRYQAKAQQSQLAYQSQLAQINRDSANLQADSIRMAGQRQIGAITRRAGDIKALQRARLGASGIALDSASAIDVMTRSDLMKELDAIEILKNAVAKEGAARMGATNFDMAANTYAQASSQMSPTRAAGGGFLSDSITVASNWYYLKNAQTGALGGNTTLTNFS